MPNEIHLSLRKTGFCLLFHCFCSVMKNHGVKAKNLITLMHSLIVSKMIQFTYNIKDVYKEKKPQFFLALIASIYAFETSPRIYFSNMNFGTFKNVFGASFKNDARISRKCELIKWYKRQFSLCSYIRDINYYASIYILVFIYFNILGHNSSDILEGERP